MPLARGCYSDAAQRTFRVRVQAQARRPRDDDWVSFDGEEEWDEVSCLYFVRFVHSLDR